MSSLFKAFPNKEEKPEKLFAGVAPHAPPVHEVQNEVVEKQKQPVIGMKIGSVDLRKPSEKEFPEPTKLVDWHDHDKIKAEKLRTGYYDYLYINFN